VSGRRPQQLLLQHRQVSPPSLLLFPLSRMSVSSYWTLTLPLSSLVRQSTSRSSILAWNWAEFWPPTSSPTSHTGPPHHPHLDLALHQIQHPRYAPISTSLPPFLSLSVT
jgi:hypothetical protein